mmetsp:Transcript_20031/g.51624  ORF Transcript_20031/g.51624 Transcript_20031/m.51624 type:complete len:156 (-) Transcript_20031:329-796(-)
MEHLTAGPQNMLLNIARALKPGGVLILTTPNSNSLTTLQRVLAFNQPFSYAPFRKQPHQRLPGPEHIKEYSVNEIDSAFLHAGFNMINVTTISPYGHLSIGMDMLHFLVERLGERFNIGRRGEVHLIAAESPQSNQQARARYRAFKPLYDFTEIV